MARGYDSGYGSRASCFVALDKAPVRWQLDSRENLDRLVATSQPGALVSGLNYTAATLREWVSESCCARWKAQSHCLQSRTSVRERQRDILKRQLRRGYRAALDTSQ